MYTGFGGVLAGGGFGALLAGVTTNFVGWSLAWGVTASFAAMVPGLYMILGVSFGWPLPGRKSKMIQVIEAAQQLSQEILLWMTALEGSEPFSWPLRGASRELLDHQFRERNERSEMLSRTMQQTWNDRFSARALFCYDQLIKFGAEPQGDRDFRRFYVEFPNNRIVMREVAQQLGVMATHLQFSKSV